MRYRTPWPIVLLIAVFATTLISGLVLAQTGGGYNLTWNTIDGGGGRSSGGNYQLTASLGQADAGPNLTGGSYSLSGGFLNVQPTSVPPTSTVPTAVPTTTTPKVHLPFVRR